MAVFIITFPLNADLPRRIFFWLVGGIRLLFNFSLILEQSDPIRVPYLASVAAGNPKNVVTVALSNLLIAPINLA